MANITVALGEVAAHAVLAGATVDTVTFSEDLDRVQVLNRDGAAALWFTVDGTTPAANGAKSYSIPSAGWLTVVVPTAGNTVVKLISAGTPAYSVQRA